VAELLLSTGADPNAATDTGVTPLMAAVSCNPAAVGLLLKHGTDISRVDEQGTDAMLAAALQGDAQVIAALIQHGADPFQRRATGMSPVEAAEAAGHAEIASIIRGLQGPSV
jgi:ankyrin repeat protein